MKLPIPKVAAMKKKGKSGRAVHYGEFN